MVLHFHVWKCGIFFLWKSNVWFLVSSTDNRAKSSTFDSSVHRTFLQNLILDIQIIVLGFFWPWREGQNQWWNLPQLATGSLPVHVLWCIVHAFAVHAKCTCCNISGTSYGSISHCPSSPTSTTSLGCTIKKRSQTTTPWGEVQRRPKELGLFLAQVWTYMQEYGLEITTACKGAVCEPDAGGNHHPSQWWFPGVE